MKSILINNIFYLNFNLKSLIPVIVQEIFTKKNLMLAWLNFKNIFNIFYFNNIFYLSRSVFKTWLKGNKSLNVQYLKKFFIDCDMDSIVIQVIQLYNISCHTKSFSCFKKIHF